MMLNKSLFLGCLLVVSALIANAADDAALSANKEESYQIRNQKFGELLRPKDANDAEGTAIVLYPAQPWKCMTWKLQPTGESEFHVQNHFTGKTFHVKPGAAGQPVVQTALAPEAKDRPVWQVMKLTDGSYRISDVKSGEVLTAVDGGGGSIHITTAKWEGKPEQKWNLEKIDPATLTM